MLITNRFGRIVNVSDEQGREMINKKEAELYDPEPMEDKEPDNTLECPYCGKVCANKIGFNKHVEACKKKAASSQLSSPVVPENEQSPT